MMSGETQLSRREFFKSLFGQGVDSVGKMVTQRVSRTVERKWPRPPGAVDELEFLTLCTRCDMCVDACPQKVIELLDSRAGAAYRTPVLNLAKGGCQWCPDIPCISACPSEALQKNSSEAPLKPLAKLHVALENCLAAQGQDCDFCKRACPSHIDSAISMGFREPPKVDPEKCVGCGECVFICVSQTGPVFSLEPL